MQTKDLGVQHSYNTLDTFKKQFPNQFADDSESTMSKVTDGSRSTRSKKTDDSKTDENYLYLNKLNFRQHSNLLGSLRGVMSPIPRGPHDSELAVQQVIGGMMKGFIDDLPDSTFSWYG